MASIQTRRTCKCDLDLGTTEIDLTGSIMHQDALADVFCAEVCRGKTPVDLTGMTVRGYFYVASTRQTLLLPGEASGNQAAVALSSVCYQVPGYASLIIQLQQGDVRHTVLKVNLCIDRTGSDNVADPDNVLPTLAELLGQIAAMEQATAEARTATEETRIAANEVLKAAQTLSASAGDPIIPTASGSVIRITDSANRPLAVLRLYGKTTQAGTPTPSAPVPLVNVGAGGSIQVYVCGDNLYDMSQGYGANILQPLPVKAGEYYSVAAYPTAGETQFNFRLWYADGTTLDHSIVEAEAANNQWRIVSAKTDKEISSISFYNVGTGNRGIGKIMVRLGNYTSMTDADYVPYAGSSASFSTPHGLPGIPVSTGGNYTDENGQQWICDEIDFGREVYVKRLYHKHLQGNETPTVVNNCFVIADTAATEQVGNRIILTGAMTNYIYLDYVKLESGEHGVTYAYNWRFRLPDMNPDKNTVAECKAWLANNPIDILVPTQTPIETPIPADELAAYRAMTSQYPSTTILNDGGAGMKASYVADTKSYIDQRIAAIAAAMINA